MEDVNKFVEVLINEFKNKINSNCRDADTYISVMRLVEEKKKEYEKSRKR